MSKGFFDPSKYPKGDWVIPEKCKISYIEPKNATLANRIIMFIMKKGAHTPETLNVAKIFAHLKKANKFRFLFWIFTYKKGVIASIEKEKAVVRVAWRTGNIYEYSQHKPFLEKAGLNKAEIDSISQESSPMWDDKTRAIMVAVDELLVKHKLNDKNWDNLRKYYNEEQMMEFLVVVGYYIMIAITINSAGIELESFSWLK
ncbi:MAG: carboxymuconolactone decarboxylase family protein [Spirochaetota bacterium]